MMVMTVKQKQRLKIKITPLFCTAFRSVFKSLYDSNSKAKNKETACLGSAILAAVGVGKFESVEDAAKMIALDKAYESCGVDYGECYERYLSYDKLLNN